MSRYKKGDIVEGKITSIENYGAFIKIDEEYGGLVHISEMTDKFVNDVNDFFDINEIVSVKIISDVVIPSQLKLSIKEVPNNNIKRKKRKIKESAFGFYLLKKQLPKWIEEKMKEFDKKN